MQTGKIAIAEIKERGQLTIPKRIRDAGHLEEGREVSLIPVGECLVITPRRLPLDEARRRLKALLGSSDATLDDLLLGLREGRNQFFHDTYGKARR
jgi:AbrB family looped-hinge helix DNA binding protein